MKYVYVAFKLIWKRKLLSLLIILEITVSSYYLFPILSEYIYYLNVKSTIESINTENVYYLLASTPYAYDSYLYDALNDKARKTGYVDSIGEVFTLYEDKNMYNLLVYNEAMVSNFSPFLYEGDWFTEHVNSTTNIPVVVGQGTGLNIDDLFGINIDIYDFGKQGTLTIRVDCAVIGVMDTPTLYMDLSGGADEGYFKLDFMLGNDPNTIILPLCQELDDFLDSNFYYYTSYGRLIFTTGYIDYETIKNDLGYYGGITDMSNGKSYFHTYVNNVIISFGYYFLIYFLISIIGIVCLNVVQNISNRMNFTIYFLLGMSQKQGAIIESVRVLVLMLFSIAGILVYHIFSGSLLLLFEPSEYLLVCFTTILYVAIAFIPVSIGFIISNTRYNIIDAVKNLFVDK